MSGRSPAAPKPRQKIHWHTKIRLNHRISVAQIHRKVHKTGAVRSGRHLARAGGGPRTGLDSRPPAARLSLQYGRYSLPRWSSSLISTPDLDDGVFCYRSELVRVHCTYSYTHFNGKPGALALRSDETTVPFAGTFRTGVGRGCGSAGEAALPPPLSTPPPAPCLFMNGRRPYWMNRVHGAVGRYFRGRAALGVRGGRPEAGCERSRCQILRRGRRQRMCSFTKLPARSPRAAASRNWVSGRRESRHWDTAHFRPA